LETLNSNPELGIEERMGYDERDRRIAMMRSRKESLTLVLKFPKLSLPNNASEHETQVQARESDISLHTINNKRTEEQDTLKPRNRESISPHSSRTLL